MPTLRERLSDFLDLLTFDGDWVPFGLMILGLAISVFAFVGMMLASRSFWRAWLGIP